VRYGGGAHHANPRITRTDTVVPQCAYAITAKLCNAQSAFVARLGAGVAGMESQEECVCSCIVLASYLSLYLGPCATRLVTQFRFTTALGLRQLCIQHHSSKSRSSPSTASSTYCLLRHFDGGAPKHSGVATSRWEAGRSSSRQHAGTGSRGASHRGKQDRSGRSRGQSRKHVTW
jgi:hypothetical protein